MKPAVGRVYVLTNKAMPGLLKIGYTMNTVEGRVKELSSATGVPSEFVIEYQIECRDAASVEALVHESLTSLRHNNNREFFSASIEEAVKAIRQHAKEILDEEFNESVRLGMNQSAGFNVLAKERIVTLYLIKASDSRKIFRIGLIQEPKEFLQTDEFKSMIIDLYDHFDSNFFYECHVVEFNEFSSIDNDSFEKMKTVLDGNISRLKTINKSIFDPTKYDLRTLAFKEFRDQLPIQVYKSTLSLIQPLAQTCLDTENRMFESTAVSKIDSTALDKSIRLDAIRRMGI